MSTTTNLDKLKINYLTQEQYEDAVENEEINENELYFTPGHNNDAIVPVELTQAEYDALTTEQKNNGMVYCVSDANGTYLTASEVSYGSSSVQDALDDLEEKTTVESHMTTVWNRSNIIFYTDNDVVSFYLSVSELLDTTHFWGTLPDELRPKYTYAILPLFSTSPPYAPIGSLWLYSDGKMYGYQPTGVTEAYAFGTYIRKTTS